MSYTIQAGDAPASIAARFGFTVAQLSEANSSNPGFDDFVVATVIKLPLGSC